MELRRHGDGGAVGGIGFVILSWIFILVTKLWDFVFV